MGAHSKILINTFFTLKFHLYACDSTDLLEYYLMLKTANRKPNTPQPSKVTFIKRINKFI